MGVTSWCWSIGCGEGSKGEGSGAVPLPMGDIPATGANVVKAALWACA